MRSLLRWPGMEGGTYLHAVPSGQGKLLMGSGATRLQAVAVLRIRCVAVDFGRRRERLAANSLEF